ncbi:Protein CWC15 homolog A [Linum perenne]
MLMILMGRQTPTMRGVITVVLYIICSDDEAATMAELNRIRKERAEEKLQQEEQEGAVEELKVKEAELLCGNPLLNNNPTTLASLGVKRRWDDDVVFKNQSRGETKRMKRLINDTIRNDFHGRFLSKYSK